MTIHADKYACLVAPMVVPIAVFSKLIFSGNSVYSCLFTTVSYGLVSYLGFHIFILPINRYFKNTKSQILALLSSGIIGGALMATLPFYLLAIMLGSRNKFDIQATAIGCFFGGTVAIVFYLLSRNSEH